MLWDFITHVAQAAMQAIAARLACRAVDLAWEKTMAKNESTRTTDYFTVPEAAELLGLPPIHVVRTYERGFLPPAKRFGRMRMIPVEDLEKVRAAAKEAGYEPAAEKPARKSA
jgi:hypothetical protein